MARKRRNNLDIKIESYKAGVCLYELADYLSISHSAFYEKLWIRELTVPEKEKIFDALEKLADV